MKSESAWTMGSVIVCALVTMTNVVLAHTAQEITARIGLSILLIGLAGYDACRARVPNLVVMPLMMAVFPIVVVRWTTGDMTWNQVALVAAVWFTCFGLWWIRAVGAGDAKLVMALVGIFPDSRLLLVLLMTLLLGSAATLVVRYGSAGLRRVSAILVAALVGRTLPRREEIAAAYDKRSHPALIWISVGSLLYIWWIW